MDSPSHRNRGHTAFSGAPITRAHSQVDSAVACWSNCPTAFEEPSDRAFQWTCPYDRRVVIPRESIVARAYTLGRIELLNDIGRNGTVVVSIEGDAACLT